MTPDRPAALFARPSSLRAALARFTLDRFALALACGALLLAAGMQMKPEGDTWWQLRTGQLILQTGSVPTADPFSSTARGAHWPNHEWLAEVIFYGAYGLGGLPLLLLCCTALVGLCWGAVHTLLEGPGRVRAAALGLGLCGHALVWVARPHLFSLALLALALALLPGRRRHWLYPPLFLVWANLHAGVAFGASVLVAAFVAALLCDRKQAPHWLAVGGLSAAATLVNPLGLGLWTYVLGAFGDVARANLLEEWRAPSLSWPVSYPFFAIALVAVVSVWRARHTWRGHRDWTLLLLALLFLVLGLRSIRHTPSFVIVAIPLITRQFRQAPPAPRRGVAFGALNGALVAALAVGGAALVAGRWAERAAVPPIDGQVVAAVRACEGTLFNTYNTGGPLIWAAPERPVFIDNRQDPYPAELLFAVVAAQRQAQYEDLFAAHDVACALVSSAGPLHAALREAGWQELHADQQLAVLRRPGAN